MRQCGDLGHSALDVGLKPSADHDSPKRSVNAFVETQMATLPLSHETSPLTETPAAVATSRPAWTKRALVLVRDLGAVLSLRKEALHLDRHCRRICTTITSNSCAASPFIRWRGSGRWQLNDPCVGVIVARLLKGCSFHPPPSAGGRVAFARVLAKLRR